MWNLLASFLACQAWMCEVGKGDISDRWKCRKSRSHWIETLVVYCLWATCILTLKPPPKLTHLWHQLKAPQRNCTVSSEVNGQVTLCFAKPKMLNMIIQPYFCERGFVRFQNTRKRRRWTNQQRDGKETLEAFSFVSTRLLLWGFFYETIPTLAEFTNSGFHLKRILWRPFKSGDKNSFTEG